MRAIVVLDHGSRSADANAQLEELARRLAPRLPGTLVRVAHLELAEPNLAEAIDACAAAGATEIWVHPFFVATGRHVGEDIPRQVAACARRYPELAIRVTPPLGLHPSVVDAVLARIAEAVDAEGAGS